MFDEIRKIVRTLNQEVFKQCGETGYDSPVLILETDGFRIKIYIKGDMLWYSEGDEREYDEEKGEYEPLEQYLRREAQNKINQIRGISLYKTMSHI